MGWVIARAATIALITLGGCSQSGNVADSGPPSPSAPSTPISPTTEPSPSPTEEEEEEDEQDEDEQATPERPLDETAVLAMLKKYVALYNQGDYFGAAAHLSSNVQSRCLGDVVEALAQNHLIEGIDYAVSDVRAWTDEPNMADVVTSERYGGQSYRLELGLAFVLESGRWKLDDLYPLGAGAFC